MTFRPTVSARLPKAGRRRDVALDDASLDDASLDDAPLGDAPLGDAPLGGGNGVTGSDAPNSFTSDPFHASHSDQADDHDSFERSDERFADPLVRKLGRLARFSAQDRSALRGLSAGARGVESTTDLVREGDVSDGGILLLEGFACCYKLRFDGARQITSYLVPGDLCDLDPLAGTMRHAIGTISPCKVVRLSRETMTALTQTHPAIARALRVAALIDEATMREWLMNIGRRSAEERIAHLFCELYTRCQAVGLVQQKSFKVPLTQFDLGDTIGLSYVHVNRTLQALRLQGMIQLRNKTLTILDLPRLQALAEFKPDYLQP